MNTLAIMTGTLTAQLLGRNAGVAVAGPLAAINFGTFGGIAEALAINALPFINAIAVLVIVIAGILAVIAQDEGRIANARKVVAMSLVGIILVNVAGAIALAFMQSYNFDLGADPIGGANSIAIQIFGIISFLETPAAVIAIITIISYGIKAVVDYNGDQGIAAFKKAVISVLLGILLITIKYLVADAITLGNPSGIITPAIRVLLTVLGFVAFIGVVVIAIAGIVMIVNIGDESRYEKAKKVIISVVAGLILMAIVFGLLNIVITGLF
ncbi:hypothetical protein COU75_03310 [Candidatus Peregrinibacteria bacterium CG10_big_fil_rev_8_21_14_0_10_42_8]|nr:MAG: hypothetical protein COU75_03310 [Candidatus Peregrinibacteria bacterium CG10_big_fil_rev_8_21_14_0_10_42_8]